MATVMDINQIKKLLPHRYPFLLVDRVTELTDEGITAIKNVTSNEPFFNGHFPDQPIMPGVLMIEAMAQVGGLFALQKMAQDGGKRGVTLFAGVDGVKWKKPVTPGDQLVFKVKISKMRLPLLVCEGTATVDGEIACEIAELKLMLMPEKK